MTCGDARYGLFWSVRLLERDRTPLCQVGVERLYRREVIRALQCDSSGMGRGAHSVEPFGHPRSTMEGTWVTTPPRVAPGSSQRARQRPRTVGTTTMPRP